MYARVTRGISTAGSAEELTRTYEERILPVLRMQCGFRSATLLVDRGSNEFISITHWATLEELEATQRNGIFNDQLWKVLPYAASRPERTVFEVVVAPVPDHIPLVP